MQAPSASRWERRRAKTALRTSPVDDTTTAEEWQKLQDQRRLMTGSGLPGQGSPRIAFIWCVTKTVTPVLPSTSREFILGSLE